MGKWGRSMEGGSSGDQEPWFRSAFEKGTPRNLGKGVEFPKGCSVGSYVHLKAWGGIGWQLLATFCAGEQRGAAHVQKMTPGISLNDVFDLLYSPEYIRNACYSLSTQNVQTTWNALCTYIPQPVCDASKCWHFPVYLSFWFIVDHSHHFAQK